MSLITNSKSFWIFLLKPHAFADWPKKGIVIFGHHTTPKKVSIETDNFKAVTTASLEKLAADEVYQKIKDEIKLIN